MRVSWRRPRIVAGEGPEPTPTSFFAYQVQAATSKDYVDVVAENFTTSSMTTALDLNLPSNYISNDKLLLPSEVKWD